LGVGVIIGGARGFVTSLRKSAVLKRIRVSVPSGATAIFIFIFIFIFMFMLLVPSADIATSMG
jgi:hypothetical protein